MSPAQDGAKPGSGPGHPQPLVLSEQSALDRLRRIQKNQGAIWRDLVDNWPGWVFSAFLHMALLVLSVFIITKLPDPPREFVLEQGYDDSLTKLTEEPLDDIFRESPVDADIDEMPSVEAERDDDKPGYTELDPGAPDYMTLGGHLTGIGGAGGGGDHLAGKKFGGYLRRLRQSGLDVVFVFDSTGSMAQPIQETKSRIRQLMSVVSYMVPDARLGLVTYRDKKEFDPDMYEYTVKRTSLTKNVKPLEKFLRGVEAWGGLDIPEAVYEGLDAAMHLNWNQGTKKVIILFGDAPPRPEKDGLNKVYDLCAKWHKRTGGLISCIDTSEITDATGHAKLMQEFKDIAAAGGGEVMALSNERDMIRQLVIYIFGSEWESEVDKVYSSVLKGPADVEIIEGDD